MNCKPGDLAVQVGTFGSFNKYLGAIVECVSFSMESGEPVWRVKPLVPSDPGIIDECHDKHLRPIRDPGDDAIDETLTWLPVPSRERETA